jgi:uncharacterized protein (TIGR01244 family)
MHGHNTHLRRISEQVWISGQVSPGAMGELAKVGFSVLVNHRPDGEDLSQPTAAAVAEAAKNVGIRTVHAPIRGLPDADAVTATRAALEGLEANGKALLFCRSGMRSAAAWAMAERSAGGEPETLRDAAAAAGYDLSRLPL